MTRWKTCYVHEKVKGLTWINNTIYVTQRKTLFVVQLFIICNNKTNQDDWYYASYNYLPDVNDKPFIV